MALSNNAMESILTAMDIIADSKVNKVSYDSTAICTIVDDSDKKNGCYIVTDGTIEFKAYSEVANYKVGEQIRVSIPNGDYTKDKYIEGKYVTDNNISPITYVSPLDSVVEMGGLLDRTQQSVSGNLIANKDGPIKQEKGTILKTIKLDNNIEFKDLQENNIYDTIFLRADFRSLLDNKKIRSGTFGLRLDLRIHTDSKSNSYINHSLYLDSSEMLGNPYAFTVFTTQAKKFDISKIGTISQITLCFYQRNDFTYYDGKNTVPLQVEKDGSGKKIENLFVKNIYFGFGSDISVVTDNTIKLYTNDPNDFKHFGATDESNVKSIGFLWYNKNDLNQYVGFSDGIVDVDESGNIIDYDEISYLEESKKNARLVAQKGKEVPTDEIGLDLSADIEEAVPLLKEASKLITSDLENTLKGFQERVNPIAEFDVQRDYITPLSGIAEEIKNIRDTASEYYTSILARGAVIQKKQQGESVKIPVQIPVFNYPLINQIEDIFNNLHNKFYNVNFDATVDRKTSFIPSYREKIETSYQGFQGIYDTYAIRVSKIFEELNELLNTLRRCFADEQELLRYNKEEEETELIVDYLEPDLSRYDNRYCVYWYRYVKGYSDKNEPFMDKEWQRFTPEYEFNSSSKTLTALPKNTGLPSGYITNGETHFLNKKPAADEGTLTIFLNPELKQEKFTVVVIYNHEVFKSEELVFNNIDTFADLITVDKSDALRIEHGKNSLETYQPLYSTSNFLTNSKDASVIRELRVRYDGLLHKDEALIGAQVYWYVPDHTTMIAAAARKLAEAGFKSDINDEVKSEYYRKGYTCFYKQIKAKEDGTLDEEDTYFYYKIKDYYSPTYLRNTIFCYIEKNEYPFETDISLTFGTLGTSGTDYTLVVVPSTSQTTVKEDTPLPLTVALYDYNNEPIKMYGQNKDDSAILSPGTAFNARVEWMGPTAYAFNLIEAENDQSICGGEAISISMSGSHCGIAKVITSFMQGTAGEAEKEDNNVGKRYRQIDLATLYPIAWSIGDYYIEGATSIVYDSYGKNPNYYKNPYRIFRANTDEELTNVRWDIKYFIGENGKSPVELTPSNEEYDIYMSYMPVLNDKNSLTPCNMYINDINCYPVVQCFIDGTLYWSQPIIIIQNRYPSAMLNSWDGSLTIDEKNGTILSTMIGAGRKTSNNTFEGVLMGDVAIGANIETDNKSGLGIYGFHDGAQSFGLNIDGTAFFGKSGRGRIEFDGDKGIIKSASYQQDDTNNTLAGMMIDLDDGIIDMHGAILSQQGQWIPAQNSRIKISVLSPYLQIISQQGKDLLHIGVDGYYLQSNNYNTGLGMKIDLQEGKIDSYNFELTAKGLHLNSNPGNNQDYFSIGGTTNYIKLIKANENGDTNLSINSKIFTLIAGDNPNNIIIDSQAIDYPLSVGNNFKVSWNGALNATGVNLSGIINAEAGGTIGGWIIDGTRLFSTYDLDASGNETSSFILSVKDFEKTILDGNRTELRLSIGERFAVDKHGKIFAGDAQFWDIYINRATIDNAKIPNATITDANIKSGTIGGWTIDETNGLVGSGITLNKNQLTLGDVSLKGDKWKQLSINGVTVFHKSAIFYETITSKDIYIDTTLYGGFRSGDGNNDDSYAWSIASNGDTSGLYVKDGDKSISLLDLVRRVENLEGSKS